MAVLRERTAAIVGCKPGFDCVDHVDRGTDSGLDFVELHIEVVADVAVVFGHVREP
eukprot:CAMPEP_0116907334 /NCGR_PEP_ID=MMETSP0467-20121206/13056_1 /TAXON_ID=283647 /ORGANISM="Mesodinium pulex, Strain SPMC105" /LENGTH=55 /DNA_ID=CAMNT_0004582357 /DNA_START=1543 /DNA_END=1710 /DNA_ORIENTATION=+